MLLCEASSPERHRLIFGGVPGNHDTFNAYRDLIEERVQGNYRVRCGHCGHALFGSYQAGNPVTEIVWTQDGSWFGRFEQFDPS